MKLLRESNNLEGTWSIGVQGSSDTVLRVPFDTNVCNREAVGQRCDVTNWDSQLALFELGMSTFGAIDVVVWPASTKVDDYNDPWFLDRLLTLVSTKVAAVSSTSLKW